MSTPSADDVVIARNPATGAELARIPASSAEAVALAVQQARAAQERWAATSWPERREVLRRWWATLAAQADDWTDAITTEVGKPRNESRIEVVSTLDSLRWLVQRGGRALADERIGPGWQRWMGLTTAHLRWQPYGVVGKLGTWNYPLYLNAPPIAAALAAGNAVVWKPSELAASLGARIQRTLDEVGFPKGLVQTVQGGPEVGRALMAAPIDKGMFTGGLEAGRAILSELGRRGIPAVAELSGFDAAIVLPDAPRASTVRALTWAAFVGCGQTCVAVKRLYVVGDPAPWAEALAKQAKALRLGDPTRNDVDMGPMISPGARDRFDRTIHAAIAAGARVLAGGSIASGDLPGAFYPPTVLLATSARPESSLSGCFGPVLIVRGVASVDEAVAAANASPFGLGASVWGRDRRVARAVARQLRAGTVGVNEAVTSTAHAGAPFGGFGASGVGRVHGVVGLREFVQPQVLHARHPGGFRPQLFPCHPQKLARLLALYCRLFHPRS